MKKACIILLVLLLTISGCDYNWKSCLHSIQGNQEIPDNDELIFTKEEEAAIGKWKHRSMDDLIADASQGDPAGLWYIGMSFLTGMMDFPLDTNWANKYFSLSASMGFAPSLDQLRRMYFNDEQNPFLSLVYLNLTVSAGHPELVRFYHRMRDELIASGGEKIIDEIEKIALHKKALISKFVNKVKNESNGFIKISTHESISYEDYQYDNDYWLDVDNGNNEALDLSNIKECDNIYLDKLYGIYYQAITSDDKNFDFEIQEIIKEMQSNSYSNAEIEKLRKQARSQAKKIYKYVCKVTNDAKQAEKNIKLLEEYKDSIQ